LPWTIRRCPAIIHLTFLLITAFPPTLPNIRQQNFTPIQNFTVSFSQHTDLPTLAPLRLKEIFRPVQSGGEGCGSINQKGWCNMTTEIVLDPLCEFSFTDLLRMTVPQLLEVVRRERIGESSLRTAPELAFRIASAWLAQGMPGRVVGVLEVIPDGYGLLRSPEFDYAPSPCDVYVAPSQVRRYQLRTGDVIAGPIRAPREGEAICALTRVESINGSPPEDVEPVVLFEERQVIYPSERLRLEDGSGDLTLRVLELICPLGKGQRCAIVGPPRSGKTTLLEKIAGALARHHAEVTILVLMVDETPEDLAHMKETLRWRSVEVVGTTFDETWERHCDVAGMVLDRARRMVEVGRDVVLLLDSLTRLARAYNCRDNEPGRGRIFSSGVNLNFLAGARRFWGSARNLEGPGSLTILSTLLLDTGSRMDDVIYEEFRGTGNAQIHLDQRLASKGIWPAIDVNRSGTQKEDRLVGPEELHRLWILRRVLADMQPSEAMDLLTGRLAQTGTNTEFLESMRVLS
jgi:transcription termination factor Rho